MLKKLDPTHEPEMHITWSTLRNKLLHHSGNLPSHCRLWSVEVGGVQSLECEVESVASGEVRGWSVQGRVWSVECEALRVECEWEVRIVKWKIWNMEGEWGAINYKLLEGE